MHITEAKTSERVHFDATEHEAREARRVGPEMQTLGASCSGKKLEFSIGFSGGVQLRWLMRSKDSDTDAT